MPDSLGHLRIREAARILDCHENTVRNLIASGRLTAVELNGWSKYKRVVQDDKFLSETAKRGRLVG